MPTIAPAYGAKYVSNITASSKKASDVKIIENLIIGARVVDRLNFNPDPDLFMFFKFLKIKINSHLENTFDT
jgi:hypothetical protein